MDNLCKISHLRKIQLLNHIENFDTEVNTYYILFGDSADICNYFVTQSLEKKREDCIVLSRAEHNMVIALSNYFAHTMCHSSTNLKMTDIKLLATSEWSMSYSNTTLIIDSLVKKGLLERYQLPNNRKNLYIRFTEAGNAHVKAIHDEFINTVNGNLSYLNEEERKDFFACYKKIFNYIKPLIEGITNK